MSDPPNQTLPSDGQPQQNMRSPFSKAGIISLLILIGLLLLLFSSLLVVGLTQMNSSAVQSASVSTPTTGVHASPTSHAKKTRTATPTPAQGLNATPTVSAPIFSPRNTILPALQLPGGHYVIY